MSTQVRKPVARPTKTDVRRSGEAFPKPRTHPIISQAPSAKKSGHLNIR